MIKVYKTVYVVTVLSNDPNYNNCLDLSVIANETEYGDAIGHLICQSHIEVAPDQLADECAAVGSDVTFFDQDDDTTEFDDNEEI